MPSTIVSNNIPSPELREAVNKAVREGIGDRLGEWKVIVYQAPDHLAFAVRIEGPEGLRWNWTFFGQEQAPEFIRERVAGGIAGQLSLREGFTGST